MFSEARPHVHGIFPEVEIAWSSLVGATLKNYLLGWSPDLLLCEQAGAVAWPGMAYPLSQAMHASMGHGPARETLQVILPFQFPDPVLKHMEECLCLWVLQPR